MDKSQCIFPNAKWEGALKCVEMNSLICANAAIFHQGDKTKLQGNIKNIVVISSPETCVYYKGIII